MALALILGKKLRYTDPEDRIFNRAISDISVVLRDTTLTISGFIETGLPVESGIVTAVSLSTTEISEITRFGKPIFRVWIPQVPFSVQSDILLFFVVVLLVVVHHPHPHPILLRHHLHNNNNDDDDKNNDNNTNE